jgi:UDPglucose 6-dehydrogenase
VNIGIVGSGYVGLVTGACFAELGHEVLCMDDDPEKIAILKAGKIPIYEPGLEELIRSNVEEGNLNFTSSMKEVVEKSKILFVCVGTPSKPNGEADLSAVETVGKRIGDYLNDSKLIVEKSTVPARTASWLGEIIRTQNKRQIGFDIAVNPEFLSEGTAIHDFMRPDRVVLGVSNQQAASLLVSLYEPLNAPILITDVESAELIKHASNAFLAMKISFINAVSQVCEKTGADILKVAKGIGLDSRIGTAFLNAGVGYGGACFPKDLAAFVHLAEVNGYNFGLLKEVAEVNQNQRQIPVKKLREIYGDLNHKTIGIMGLSFKPNTDDLREAPSLEIISSLIQQQVEIKAYDPAAAENMKKLFPHVYYARDPYDCAADCDAVLLLTEWQIFRHMNLSKIRKSMNRPVFIDGRNLFDPVRMFRLGFQYFGIGRSSRSLAELST